MLNETDFQWYYEQLDIRGAVRDEIEEIRKGAPARAVGNRALVTHSPELFSRCNQALRCMESGTTELPFALQCELDQSVLAYWCQPSLKNVERNGKTNSTTADFLVFRQSGIEVVECKKSDQLRQLAEKDPGEWLCDAGKWSRPALERWAGQRALRYRVWCPPEPHAIYLANLHLLYDRLDWIPGTIREMKALRRLDRELQQQPLTIGEALNTISGLSGPLVVIALARARCYGTLMSVPLDDPDRFTLYGLRDRAIEADAIGLACIARKLAQPAVDHPVLNARPVDYEKGSQRLAYIQNLIESGEKPPPYWRALHRRVVTALVEGTSPLTPCLPRYHCSGRRVPQLTEGQLELLHEFVQRYVNTSEYVTKKQAHFNLKRDCDLRGIRPPSYETFRKYIRLERRDRRAMAVEGKRGYHAIKPASDPTQRVLPALAFGLTVHVDSTLLDLRCVAELGDLISKERPTLYLAIDEATSKPLGRALLFGPASRDHLAVLFRDIVARQGFLPRNLVTDRGSEYRSHWFRELCLTTGMNCIRPPAGAPRYNSEAENPLGRVNRLAAHLLTGSTAPDRMNRRVDAAFKSYRTARHAFSEVVKQVDALLFDDISRTPVRLRPGTPAEHEIALIEQLGRSGIPMANDENFAILTSIPLDRDVAIDPVQGIRHLGRRYSSRSLLARIASQRVLEKRRDCVDPTKIYVKFDDGWVTAMAANCVRLASLHDNEKLFETMIRPEVARTNRERREQVAAARADRIAQSNASAASITHLRSCTDETPSEVPSPPDWLPPGTESAPYETW